MVNSFWLTWGKLCCKWPAKWCTKNSTRSKVFTRIVLAAYVKICIDGLRCESFSVVDWLQGSPGLIRSLFALGMASQVARRRQLEEVTLYMRQLLWSTVGRDVSASRTTRQTEPVQVFPLNSSRGALVENENWHRCHLGWRVVLDAISLFIVFIKLLLLLWYFLWESKLFVEKSTFMKIGLKWIFLFTNWWENSYLFKYFFYKLKKLKLIPPCRPVFVCFFFDFLADAFPSFLIFLAVFLVCLLELCFEALPSAHFGKCFGCFAGIFSTF